MALPPQFLDELRSRISVASVVSRHVRLARRGREYVGLCPFHKEKTPSFTVVEDKNFYHCFGCGAHGDVVGFIMRVSNVGFREAVEELAKEAGLRVPEDSPKDREREARVHGLHDVCEAACAFFERQLREPSGKGALDYLSRRGLDAELISRFRLGWAPDSRDSLKRFLGAHFPEDLLVSAGLLKKPENGESFDFFRGRVMFPIADRSGKTIAFGGRVIGEGQPKYLNSPDTPIFDKGRTLYGLHLARSDKSEWSPIIVEGYTDVIALHRAGFGGAVAPLGTALSVSQLMELWKVGPEPIVCFDGDAAGQRAANRALDQALPFLQPELGLRFAILPEKEDPDSLLRTNGRDAFARYLSAALPVSEFLWRSATEQREAKYFSTPEKISRLQDRLTKRLSQVENRILQKNYRDFVYDRIWDLRRLLRTTREQPKGTAPADLRLLSQDQRWIGEATRKRQLEIVLLAFAINQPVIVREDIDAFAMLEIGQAELRELWQGTLEEIGDEGGERIDRLELRQRLTQRLASKGYPQVVDSIFQTEAVRGRSFAHFNAEKEWAMMGWKACLAKYRLPGLEAEREAAIARWTTDPSDDNSATMLLYCDMVARYRTEGEFVESHWERATQGEGTPLAH